ncbi:MAG: TMEM14 family protein [Bradyrhizobiaceae bacterium]|nr:TMEM14 family protein [Bradyrhizobiaceae bacterium]
MKHHKVIARYISLYGLFLIVCGVVGYVITQDHSQSSLVNGIVGGILMVVIGLLHRQNRSYTLPAAMGACGIFTITFIWRAIVQWPLVGGSSSHLVVALLLTMMTLVSVVMVAVLGRQLRL